MVEVVLIEVLIEVDIAEVVEVDLVVEETTAITTQRFYGLIEMTRMGQKTSQGGAVPRAIRKGKKK